MPNDAIILETLNLFNKYVLSIYQEVDSLQNTDNPVEGTDKIITSNARVLTSQNEP